MKVLVREGERKCGRGSKSGRERKKRDDRWRGGVEKQNATLEVDGVSCYVLLSTLGRSPTSLPSLSLSLFRFRGEKPAEGDGEKKI